MYMCNVDLASCSDDVERLMVIVHNIKQIVFSLLNTYHTTNNSEQQLKSLGLGCNRASMLHQNSSTGM